MGTHKKCARAHDSRARDEVGGEKTNGYAMCRM